MPKALKSCSKCNKSPHLVTLRDLVNVQSIFRCLCGKAEAIHTRMLIFSSIHRSLFGAMSRLNRAKPDDSPSSSFEAIDIEEVDDGESPVSSSGPIKTLSGIGSAFRQVKPTIGRRHTTDSDGSPGSSESKKDKHVWRPY